MKYLVSDPLINGDYAQMMLKKIFPQHQSLFKDTPDENLDNVAPYIFALNDHLLPENNHEFTIKAFVIIDCNLAIDDARVFFHSRIYISRDGKKYYFRCWDGRVLHTLLPTYNQQKLQDFFGPVKSFAMDSDDADFVVLFELENGNLISKRIPMTEYWNSIGVANLKEPVSEYLKEVEPEVAVEKSNEPEKPPPPPRKWNFLID